MSSHLLPSSVLNYSCCYILFITSTSQHWSSWPSSVSQSVSDPHCWSAIVVLSFFLPDCLLCSPHHPHVHPHPGCSGSRIQNLHQPSTNSGLPPPAAASRLQGPNLLHNNCHNTSQTLYLVTQTQWVSDSLLLADGFLLFNYSSVDG